MTLRREGGQRLPAQVDQNLAQPAGSPWQLRGVGHRNNRKGLVAAPKQATDNPSKAVIRSVQKDLALLAQDKLREGPRPDHFHCHARFFAGRRSDLLRTTILDRFSAACKALPFRTRGGKSPLGRLRRRSQHAHQKPRSSVLSRFGRPALGIRFSTTYSMPCPAQKARFSGLSPSSLTT